jgi:hypothetical protein
MQFVPTISWSHILMPSLEVTRRFVVWYSSATLRLGVCSMCWWQRNLGACTEWNTAASNVGFPQGKPSDGSGCSKHWNATSQMCAEEFILQ